MHSRIIFRLICQKISQGFEYGRSGNPTRNVLEACLAALENGKRGFAFSSGLGTTTAVTALLEAGDHLISSDDVYGGTNRFFQRCASRNNVKASFIDTTDLQNILNAIQPQTKVYYSILQLLFCSIKFHQMFFSFFF